MNVESVKFDACVARLSYWPDFRPQSPNVVFYTMSSQKENQSTKTETPKRLHIECTSQDRTRYIELGCIESGDGKIYPIYPKSDIYEGSPIVLYYRDRKFYPIYPEILGAAKGV